MMTFLQGMGDLGKTTVAALAISREDVRRHFHDGIAWINIGQQKLGSIANFVGISSSLFMAILCTIFVQFVFSFVLLYHTLVRLCFFLVTMHTSERKKLARPWKKHM